MRNCKHPVEVLRFWQNLRACNQHYLSAKLALQSAGYSALALILNLHLTVLDLGKMLKVALPLHEQGHHFKRAELLAFSQRAKILTTLAAAISTI